MKANTLGDACRGEKDEECRRPEKLSKIIDELEKDKRRVYAGFIGGQTLTPRQQPLCDLDHTRRASAALFT
jgi:hypothetical protein